MDSPRDGTQSPRPRPVPGIRADDADSERLKADGGVEPRSEMSGGLWRFPAVALAWQNLRRNRLRSLLAALGICIGVFVIVVLGVFGTMLQLSASQELVGIGNQMIVTPASETGEETLTSRQLQDIERSAAGRGTVVPLYSDNTLATSGGESTPTQLYGIGRPAALFEGDEQPLPTQHRGGALVGTSVASSLDLQIGSTVEVGGQSYRVIGLMASGEDITPVQPDNAVVLAEREFTGEYDQAVIDADSPEDATATAEAIRDRLNVRVEQVDLFELSEILDTIAEFFTLLNRFLIALGSVSLIVAGVSIFNLMLMSTAECRGEVGVMRAVGIHRNDVLKVLLVEAALLGVVGALFGALFSGVAAVLLWAVTPISLDLVLVWQNGAYLLGGFVFGSVVALVSGAYPAWNAATERPVEALRG